MIGGIARAVDDAQSGVDEIVMVENESESPIGNQNKKKSGDMGDGTGTRRHPSAGAYP